MTLKNKKLNTAILALVLALTCGLTYILIGYLQTTYSNQSLVRTIEISKEATDYQSILNDFDDAKLDTSGSLTTFEGNKKISMADLQELDNLSSEDLPQEEISVTYNFSYDYETNIVTLTAKSTSADVVVEVDEIQGVAFYNEDNELDALLEVDGEYILLSEMQDAGLIQNCGWFSNLFKKIVVAVVAVVVVSAVAAVVVATCGAGLGAVVAAGAIAGGITGGVAGGVISYTETGQVQFWAVLAGVAGGAIIGAVTGLCVYHATAALKITKALKAVDANKINHIMQSKHAWERLGDATLKSVSKAIDYTLANGTSAAYEAGNTIVTATYNGQTVQVVTRIVDDVLRIVDAWIKII